MIIKASSRKDGAQLARYLLTENNQQKAYVLEQRGSLANDLDTILRWWEKEAFATTKGEKPLYHMQLRLAPGETLQQAQWYAALDTVEKKLKLGNQPRVVVAHELNGETHLHVVYSRLQSERGTLLKMSQDRAGMHASAREIERSFGLRELSSAPRRERNGNEKTRSVEHRMAKEAGTNRKALCTIVQAAWDGSLTGRQFQDQLAVFGITMTAGDKRDYNIWHSGKRYDPVRLLEVVRTVEFRTKMQLESPELEAPEPQHETRQAMPARRRAQQTMQSDHGLTQERASQQNRDAQRLADELNRLILARQRDRPTPELNL